MSADEGGLPRLITLVGPTAVGKTEVAVGLAGEFAGEIVSLDSRQMYRRLEIGTAKPTQAELEAAPHHLVGAFEPEARVTLADVQALAYLAIDDILARGKLPIVSGGTGQYVAAVVEGWVIPVVPPDESLRRRLQQDAASEGCEILHERLQRIDPVAAARIDPRNIRRVIRALEVHEHTGEPISEIQDRRAPPYAVLMLGLCRPRQELYERADLRLEDMLARGLEAEVAGLVEHGLDFDSPAMSSVGYREWQEYLAGAIDRDEVVRLIRRNTRRLVRQQATWFRADDPRIRWFDLSSVGFDAIRDAVAIYLAP